MTRPILILATVLLALPSLAAADCYVEYKARQTDPLRLHFGILRLSGGCPSPGQVEQETTSRIASGGWQLLTILGHSEAEPSADKRADAGDHYLRY